MSPTFRNRDHVVKCSHVRVAFCDVLALHRFHAYLTDPAITLVHGDRIDILVLAFEHAHTSNMCVLDQSRFVLFVLRVHVLTSLFVFTVEISAQLTNRSATDEQYVAHLTVKVIDLTHGWA